VGGLAKTVLRDGYRFDLGGHRFFTKAPEVERLWQEVAGPELLVRPRLSRIHWRGRLIRYPLRPLDVLRQVGPVEMVRCLASYAGAALRPAPEAQTFEDWVTARFGRRLFELFFKTYTEKVWGVPTSEIRAEWAAQRIKDLSMVEAARSALTGNQRQVRSLIEEFHYPRLGPGQMWEAMAAEIERLGGEVRLSAPVSGLVVEDGRLAAVRAPEKVEARAVISSLPLRSVVAMLEPRAPPAIGAAAHGLRYRDFLTVALAIRGPAPFPDNWVYVHDSDVRVGRIQNFRAWSPWLVPREDRSCLGLEYFCFERDELWALGDEALIELATTELERLGMVDRGRVERGWVVRVPKAYPIYDASYAERVAAIRAWLAGLRDLHQVGRNGLHRYNNSDHSMLTAMRAVENACDGATHDVWAVNADDAYHEEAPEQPYRAAPATPSMALPLRDERGAPALEMTEP
jgi:protoporphyrinogen oxidase